MIGKLTGKVDEIYKDSLILDVNQVGYHVYCSSSTLTTLSVNQKASLIIETYVREDQISLFGFLNPLERDWFKKLTTIKGIGNKVALSILSVIEVSHLNNIILSNDNKALAKVPGVGMKLAERIILELKNCDLILNSTCGNNYISIDDTKSTISLDATSALTNLGYSRHEAFRLVTKILKENSMLDLSNIIKKALKELSNE